MVQAPGYSKIVTRPMAFSIMWERFHKGEYMTWGGAAGGPEPDVQECHDLQQARDCVPQAGKPFCSSCLQSPYLFVPAHLGRPLARAF